jgi:preprotein translocase subunit YajC
VNNLVFLVMIALAFVVLVYLPTRARNRQMRQVQTLQSGLHVGDEVMTSSGMYGRIVALWQDEIDLEVAPGVVTTWTRLAVREAKSPGRAPVADPVVADPAVDDQPSTDVD